MLNWQVHNHIFEGNICALFFDKNEGKRKRKNIQMCNRLFDTEIFLLFIMNSDLGSIKINLSNILLFGIKLHACLAWLIIFFIINNENMLDIQLIMLSLN